MERTIHRIIIGVIALFSLIAQSTFAKDLMLFGVKPDLLVAVVIAWGALKRPEEGGLVGLILGGLGEVMGNHSGGGILAATVVGIVSGFLKQTLFVYSRLRLLWIGTTLGIAYQLIFLAIGGLGDGMAISWVRGLKIVGLSGLYTGPLTLGFFMLFELLDRNPGRRRQRNRNLEGIFRVEEQDERLG
ncbi:MAG: hypothetical protein ACE5JP_03190 [Candidatus Bipolaricaulia bacterium]